MKQERLSVISCRDLNGTFVELSVPGFFLRRPISVADSDESALTLLIKTVGEGTKKLRTLAAGEVLDALTGLGNGFSSALLPREKCSTRSPGSATGSPSRAKNPCSQAEG